MPDGTLRSTVGPFLASMPDAYRDAWRDDADAVAAHAAIADVAAGDVRIRLWRSLEPDVACVIVVADDRPGLLARITTAIVAHDIDVVRAEAYCRTVAGVVQAVDLLWLRRFEAGARVRASDVAALETMVRGLVRNGIEPVPAAKARGTGEVTVRFERDPRSGALTLAVEARDRPGLLLAVTSALFRSGLQITGVRATSEDGVAKDRFEVIELDGSVVDAGRQLELQIAILAALEHEA